MAPHGALAAVHEVHRQARNACQHGGNAVTARIADQLETVAVCEGEDAVVR
jgi:hypothetical protein